MLKKIDTSYVIVIDRSTNQLCAYYDMRGKLDCDSSLLSNLVTVKNYGSIVNAWDLSGDEVNDELIRVFKDNWSRFVMIKSYPTDDCGMPFEDLKHILVENVKGYLTNNPLYYFWYS